jgi:NADH dehydrogenase [ubiquinone] 1 alpha subcomplex assembly factor 5
MDQADIFDRNTRRRNRDRVHRSNPEDRWLIAFMAAELGVRLSVVKRPFRDVLILGSDFGTFEKQRYFPEAKVTIADPGSFAEVQCDEDFLPFARDSFDLVIAFGTLDTVNDLPGALILIRHSLRADGLFLAAMMGAGCLPVLKSCVAGSGIARVHPQIEVRAAGDLLTRAGFFMPVAESETVTARYPNVFRLFGDLRANGLTNALQRRHPLSRAQLSQISDSFAPKITQKTEEQFSFIFLTGWAPSAKPVPVNQ